MKISWTNKNITHSISAIEGKGVYAIGPIEVGELIAVFGGFVCSIEDLNELKKHDQKTFENFIQTAIQVDENLVYSPTDIDQYSDIEYLNHSCEPNAGFSSPIHLVAMCAINSGEEITMDYAMCISSKIFAIEECECGRNSCRKKITENDWLIPEIQDKYRDYFQPYIKNMISKTIKK